MRRMELEIDAEMTSCDFDLVSSMTSELKYGAPTSRPGFSSEVHET